MAQWRNRIVGSGEVNPDQLLANPNNWRIHPQHQQRAIVEVLADVGWVQDIVVNQRTGFVVDGHARAANAISHDQALVPVKYVDLDEREEALILASFDVLGGAAITDEASYARVAAQADLGASMQVLADDILSDDHASASGDDEAASKAANDDIPDDSTLSWGYATFGKTRVGCSTSEVDLLEKLLEQYRGGNNGADHGFVRWLAIADRPDPGDDE